MIRLRFVTHPGVFSWAVKYAQGGYPLSHCEAYLPEGDVIGAWWDGGTQIKPADYDKGNFNNELLLSIPATAEQEAAFFAFLKSQIGKPYDALAIAAFATGRDWQCQDSWFCSELIAAAQAAAGLFPALIASSANKIMVKDVVFYNAALAKAG